MTKIAIDNEVFAKFRDFTRAVIVAANIDNDGDDNRLRVELEQSTLAARNAPELRDFSSHPRVSSWCRAFEELNLNPNRTPPSIANLLKRVRNGNAIPFINKLVCIFNIVSLRHIVPAGGDDLAATGDALCLRIAAGTEGYTPLGKPDVREIATPGEVIYYDPARNEVLCRGWCWRNSHVTRILPTTKTVAINIDGLPPLTPNQIQEIAQETAEMIRIHCGGQQTVYQLSRNNPKIDFELG